MGMRTVMKNWVQSVEGISMWHTPDSHNIKTTVT